MTLRSVVATALLAVTFLASCRTARPTGAPIAPLTASTSEQAMEQLRARRASFRGAKSLMRVRATTNGKTQSFKAQLSVQDADSMELIAYTPVGTTAAIIRVDNGRVSVDNKIEGTQSQGTIAQIFGFLGTALPPGEMAMLILGLPPRDDVQYDVAPTGLARASLGNISATFTPPAFPAKQVVITRGADRIEIEHLEVVAE